MSVADTDSGWGENYTPSSDEIKAYFNGYVMYQDGGGLYTSGTKYFAKRYQGIGTKGYLATGVVVENGSGTNQTTCPTNKAYGEDTKHYQLYYELANPTTETIATITPITTVSGQKNTISVTSDLGSIKSATITFDWAPEFVNSISKNSSIEMVWGATKDAEIYEIEIDGDVKQVKPTKENSLKKMKNNM